MPTLYFSPSAVGLTSLRRVLILLSSSGFRPKASLGKGHTMRHRTAPFLFCIVLVLFLSPAVFADPIGGAIGIFQNPIGPPGMITDLTTPGGFGWGSGTAGQARMVFNAYDYDPEFFFIPSEPGTFYVGALRYRDRDIAPGTQAGSVDLLLSFSFIDPAVSAPDVVFSLDLSNTLSTNPADNFVGLPSSIPSTAFSMGGTSYALQLSFPSDKLVSAGKGNINTIDLVGTLTATTAVPEPASLLLLGAGLGILGIVARRTRR